MALSPGRELLSSSSSPSLPVLTNADLSSFSGSLAQIAPGAQVLKKKDDATGAPVGFLAFTHELEFNSSISGKPRDLENSKKADLRSAGDEQTDGRRKPKTKKIQVQKYEEMEKRIKDLQELLTARDNLLEQAITEVKNLRANQNKQLNDLQQKWWATTGICPSLTEQQPEGELEAFQAACACVAVSRSNIGSLQKLLEYGADIHRENFDNRTALHVAATCNNQECVEFLIKQGAPLFCEDNERRTPFDDAVNHMHVGVAMILEQAMTRQIKRELGVVGFKFSDYIPRHSEGKFATHKRDAELIEEKKQEVITAIKTETNYTANEEKSKPNPHLTKRTPVKSKPFRPDVVEKQPKSPFIRKLLQLRGGKKKDASTVEAEPDDSYGVVLGILRGECLAPSCDCKCYSGQGSFCSSCSHFPAAHKRLGKSTDLLEGLGLLNIVDESSTHVLIRKYPDKEWPKQLNPKLDGYAGLLEVQKRLKEEKPEWTIESDEVEFLGEIGKGASAKVFRGHYMQNVVAIKVMEFSVAGKQKDKQIVDITQEFSIMSQIRDEHVIKLFGIIAEPQICMVLEFCELGSMYDMLKKESFVLEWPMLFKWLKESAQGLRVLHERPRTIVHRDVKTLNLLISSNYTVKVADFGLSRFVDGEASLSTLNKLRGTYLYTAPEVYHGNPYTTKADVYSLAIVLWELVYKCIERSYKIPFTEHGMIHDFQIVIQVAKKDLRPKIHPATPKPLADLMAILWRSKPVNRPDMAQLLDMMKIIENHYQQFKDMWEVARSGKETHFPESNCNIIFPEVEPSLQTSNEGITGSLTTSTDTSASLLSSSDSRFVKAKVPRKPPESSLAKSGTEVSESRPYTRNKSLSRSRSHGDEWLREISAARVMHKEPYDSKPKRHNLSASQSPATSPQVSPPSSPNFIQKRPRLRPSSSTPLGKDGALRRKQSKRKIESGNRVDSPDTNKTKQLKKIGLESYSALQFSIANSSSSDSENSDIENNDTKQTQDADAPDSSAHADKIPAAKRSRSPARRQVPLTMHSSGSRVMKKSPSAHFHPVKKRKSNQRETAHSDHSDSSENSENGVGIPFGGGSVPPARKTLSRRNSSTRTKTRSAIQSPGYAELGKRKALARSNGAADPDMSKFASDIELSVQQISSPKKRKKEKDKETKEKKKSDKT